MALDRIYALRPGTDNAKTLWAEHRLDASLVTVSQPHETPLGIFVQAESEVTLRTRYREDLTANAELLGPDGRFWYVQSWQEVGRRRFTEIALATYGSRLTFPIPGGGDLPVDPEPVDPVEPVDPPVAPGPEVPTGWNLERDGAAVTELAIADASPFILNSRRWTVEFDITGITGELTDDLYPPIGSDLRDGLGTLVCGGFLQRAPGYIVYFYESGDFTAAGNTVSLHVTNLTAVDGQFDETNASIQTVTAYPITAADRVTIFTAAQWDEFVAGIT